LALVRRGLSGLLGFGSRGWLVLSWSILLRIGFGRPKLSTGPGVIHRLAIGVVLG
jgi:hypothetical protein